MNIMAEQLSRIATVFEEIGKAINEHEDFKKIPIKWDMIEVSANNMPPTLVVLQAKPFSYDTSRCNYERQLDICIIHNTDYERQIILRLSKYAETMIELLEEFVLTSNVDIQFLQGSEMRALRNNREDSESYKGSKTLFSSMIVLSYLLRY